MIGAASLAWILSTEWITFSHTIRSSTARGCDEHVRLEHDLKGMPWTNPESYTKWPPSTYAPRLGKFRTPMLITEGELDFRVPYRRDLEISTALQRRGVPSKLIIFPDAGHWALKPQNSRLWYHEFSAGLRPT